MSTPGSVTFGDITRTSFSMPIPNTGIPASSYDPRYPGPGGRPLSLGPQVYTQPANVPSLDQNGAIVSGFNQHMMRLSEHFEPFLQRRLIEQPRFWYDRIGRSAYPLFTGFVKETRVYRGGLVQYAGLDGWRDINPVPGGGNDPCSRPGYKTYPTSFERMEWTGMETAWGSDPICLEQFLYTDEAVTQLGWILDSGAEQGIAIQEVWNRDNLIHMACKRQRGFMMSSTFGGNPNPAKFFYNPFIKFETYTNQNAVDGTVYSNTGITAPFIVFQANVELEPINFDMMEYVRKQLSTMASTGALAKTNGQNMFGLPVSMDDIEKYVSGNEREREAWLRGAPVKLIEGVDYGVTEFHRWALIADDNQLRFKIVQYIDAFTEAECVKLGGVGRELVGSGAGGTNIPVWVAMFVPPRIAGRTGENNSRVPEHNPAYDAAEIAVSPLFMGRIFENQFVTPPSSLGSGTFYGPQTGLNGTWQWLNIPTPDTNPLGTRGNFYGQFRIFAKPDVNQFYATAVAYRRCTASLRSMCPVQNLRINPDVTAEAAKLLEVTAVPAALATHTAATAANAGTTAISVRLAQMPNRAAPGLPATVKLAGVTLSSAYVMTTTSAPVYDIVIGLSNPSTTVTNAAGTGIGFCNKDGDALEGVLCSWAQAAGAGADPGPATVGAVTWTALAAATGDTLLV